MMTSEHDNEEAPTLRELYPELSEKELEEARHNIRGYLAVILRIHDRLEHRWEEDGLTSKVRDGEMKDERSDKT